MKALQERRKEEAKWQNISKSATAEKTVPEKVARCKYLQYEEHQHLFGVMYTNIHKAAFDGDVSGIKHFLSFEGRAKNKTTRVNVDDYDSNGYCPIHLAAERGKNDAIEELVKRGCNVDVKSMDGSTAMMFAAKNCQIKTMHFLLCLGASLVSQNRAGITSAHLAALGDFGDAINALYQLVNDFKGAIAKNIETRALEGQSGPSKDKALKTDIKTRKGNKNVPQDNNELEIEKNDEKDILFDCVNELLKDGKIIPDLIFSISPLHVIDQPNRNGLTPLHIAALNDSVNAAKVLIGLNVDVNARDQQGDTPMHKAGRSKCFEIFRMIKAAGGLENATNLIKETPAKLLYDSSNA